MGGIRRGHGRRLRTARTAIVTAAIVVSAIQPALGATKSTKTKKPKPTPFGQVVQTLVNGCNDYQKTLESNSVRFAPGFFFLTSDYERRAREDRAATQTLLDSVNPLKPKEPKAAQALALLVARLQTELTGQDSVVVAAAANDPIGLQLALSNTESSVLGLGAPLRARFELAGLPLCVSIHDPTFSPFDFDAPESTYSTPSNPAYLPTKFGEFSLRAPTAGKADDDASVLRAANGGADSVSNRLLVAGGPLRSVSSRRIAVSSGTTLATVTVMESDIPVDPIRALVAIEGAPIEIANGYILIEGLETAASDATVLLGPKVVFLLTNPKRALPSMVPRSMVRTFAEALPMAIFPKGPTPTTPIQS
jgi:hypothetical protein